MSCVTGRVCTMQHQPRTLEARATILQRRNWQSSGCRVSSWGGGGMHIWVADRSMRELSGTLCYRRCVTSIVLGNYACHRHCVTDIELPATMYVCFEYVCFTARHVRISWGVQRHGFFSKAQVCGAQYPSASQTQGQGLHLPNHLCHPRAPPL